MVVLEIAKTLPEPFPNVTIVTGWVGYVLLIVILYPFEFVSMANVIGRVQFIETAVDVWQAIQFSFVLCSMPYLMKDS